MQNLTPSLQGFRPCILLLLALGFNSVAALAQAEFNPVYSEYRGETADAARVIVKFRSDSALLRKHALTATASARETQDMVTARADSLGARLGMNLRTGRAVTEQSQVLAASGISSAALALRLATEPDVEYAIVDRLRTHFAVPNDPLFLQGPPISGNIGGPVVGQWYLRAPAGDVASSINASGAWDLANGTANIVVAVLDTGVRPEHPDLADRLLPGYNMVSDVLVANDGDGRDTDPSDPGDWVTAGESADKSGRFYLCSVRNSSWHGTSTASLIGAATNNGIGMAGVAWGGKLLPVRVLGKCGGYDSDIIAGMRWAAGLHVPGVPANLTPARVINMSLGGSGACPRSYLDAINAINNMEVSAVVVAAAGNASGHAVSVPANCPGVIGVASLRHIGTKVGFSDLGAEISISAPGGNCVNTTAGDPCLYPIISASNSGLTRPVASSYSDSFHASLGTSFSAPLVAGTVALMLSVQPSLTPAQVKAVLQQSARPFPSRGAAATVENCHAPDRKDQLECYCSTSTCGAGMLDAGAAVASAAAIPLVPALPTIGMDFIPSTISAAGGISTLAITLGNPSASLATLTSPLVDTLPSGVLIAATANALSNCPGAKVVAIAGSSTVTLASGAIPANGSCLLAVNVTAAISGSFLNTLLAGELQTSNGSNAVQAVATLVTIAPPLLATTTLSTQASASVQLGGSIHDTAVLAGGVSPTGTLTFAIYGPDNATCSGEAAYSSAQSVVGNGSYISSAFTPASAGTYRWIARYSGDDHNAAATGACNDANENVDVAMPPAVLPAAVIVPALSAWAMILLAALMAIAGFAAMSRELRQ